MRALVLALISLAPPAFASEWVVVARGLAADRLDRDVLIVEHRKPVKEIRFCAGATDARVDWMRVTTPNGDVQDLQVAQRVKRRTCGRAIPLGAGVEIARFVVQYEAVNPTNIATHVRLEGR